MTAKTKKSKKAKMPKQIKVGPVVYQVKHSRKAMNAAELQQKDYLLGLSEEQGRLISIEPEQPLTGLQSVLLHETLHSIFSVSGMSYKWEHDEEERMVRRLTPFLLSVLKDNPELLAYLTAEETP